MNLASAMTLGAVLIIQSVIALLGGYGFGHGDVGVRVVPVSPGRI